MNYAKHFQTKETTQSQPIPDTNQVQNSAGGYTWAVDHWTRLDRFLILGSEGGSYYVSEQKLTIENAKAVLRCIETDGERVVNRVIEISEAGRAPKNDPALFVLAMAAGMGHTDVRQTALNALPRVARIGTHLFTFLRDIEAFRGWGRGLRNAVSRWYTNKEADALAYQVVKYRQRNGWSHRDALRLAHPIAPTDNHQAIFHWVTQDKETSQLPELIRIFIKLQAAQDAREILRLIGECPSLSWEMIPTGFLGDPKIWEALLPNLPITALTRNLARMTTNGLISPLSESSRTVARRLTNQEHIRKSRLHPIAILSALATYQQGHGARGQLSWNPVTQIVNALDTAFYLSFGNVKATGKRQLLALDVSGSMGCGVIAGVPGLTPAMGTAAMAMVTARVESNYHIMGFAHKFRPLGVTAYDQLHDAMHKVSDNNFGGTDCALPMLWAIDNRVEMDTFVIYTDSETWYGNIHPAQALQEYRRKTGIPAKLVVVGMVSDNFSIADPNDAGMLDVVGFDTATPNLISDFTMS